MFKDIQAICTCELFMMSYSRQVCDLVRNSRSETSLLKTIPKSVDYGKGNDWNAIYQLDIALCVKK